MGGHSFCDIISVYWTKPEWATHLCVRIWMYVLVYVYIKWYNHKSTALRIKESFLCHEWTQNFLGTIYKTGTVTQWVADKQLQGRVATVMGATVWQWRRQKWEAQTSVKLCQRKYHWRHAATVPRPMEQQPVFGWGECDLTCEKCASCILYVYTLKLFQGSLREVVTYYTQQR